MNERVSIANMRFTCLLTFIIAAFSLLSLRHRRQRYLIQHLPSLPIDHFVWQGNFITIEQFEDWFANNDSVVTPVGKHLGDLSYLKSNSLLLEISERSPRNALNTMVA